MNIFRAFMTLDEVYNSRNVLIDEIKKSGKNYNFDKYTDAQLYRMWQRLKKATHKETDEPKHEFDLDFDERPFEYCDCGRRLSDFGYCSVCDDGEEDLEEDIYDFQPSNRSSWVSASGKPVKLPTATSINSTNQPAPTATSINSTASAKATYRVRIVSHGGRLRALGTDGVHPAAWVAFPNNLRQFEGQLYEVDQLIWNGKNYRVAGNIVEIP